MTAATIFVDPPGLRFEGAAATLNVGGSVRLALLGTRVISSRTIAVVANPAIPVVV